MRFDWERLAQLNANDFTVEDIMWTLHMWRWTAKACLDTGVRRGEFVRIGDRYSLKHAAIETRKVGGIEMEHKTCNDVSCPIHGTKATHPEIVISVDVFLDSLSSVVFFDTGGGDIYGGKSRAEVIAAMQYDMGDDFHERDMEEVDGGLPMTLEDGTITTIAEAFGDRSDAFCVGSNNC